MALSNTLHELARGLKHSRGAFLMSIAVQGICLLLFTLFAVITVNLFGFLNTARNRVEIWAFISDDANPAELSQSLKLIAGITDVTHVTKEQALEDLKKDMGNSSQVVDALGYNPLPASLRIKLGFGFATPAHLEDIERKISIMSGIREVWSGRELLARLERIFTVAIVLDIAMLLIIAISVIFIVFQSVESTISTRRKEMEIMKLVGATEATIKGPFYLEGLFQGVMGGLLAFALSIVMYEIALTQIPQPIFPILGVLIFNVVLGGVLGYLGADIALSRLVKA
jgi:cell division transport system permease protein